MLIDKIKDILTEELNLDSIDDDAEQSNYPDWDSLSYLRIVAALESEFGVEIDSSNINNFNSIPNIIREIEKINDNR